MKCKYCEAELSLNDWLKIRLSKNHSLSDFMQEMSRWEKQIMTHYYPVSCAEKYGKSGKFDI